MIRYKTVALLYTRTCPLACNHCIIESSPKASGKMNPAVVSDYIDTIARYSDEICFTGGEPLLYYNEILPLIRQARQAGLRVSLITGAGWVSIAKPNIVRERIRGLKEAGLDSLVVSWDGYHEEFSPAENALMVVESAQAIGLPVHVRGVMSATGPLPRIEQKLINIKVFYQKQAVIRLGSAASLPEDHFVFTNHPSSTRCQTVLQPSIEPDGRVYGCCGPSRSSKNEDSPLVLGDTNKESLDSIFHRAVRDPILDAINTIGPRALFRLIAEDPALEGILPVRERYTGICELCLDMSEIPTIVEALRNKLAQPENSGLLVASKLYDQFNQSSVQRPEMVGSSLS